ncbi:YrrS family protein [Alkalihalobacillus deserti]|uniref:YrrS family protein n=1 Tax=Alkalihalobacillus deserti TaxID=2879466 RepID=UPI001D15976A|nr:YrrS family protein [Alkalihalobacillus deserti]
MTKKRVIKGSGDMQGFRYEQRKKKRMNRMLNVAISIVTILILFFAYQIFFGSPSTEEVTSDEVVVEEEQESVDTAEEMQESSDEADKEESNSEETEEEPIEEEETEEKELESVPDGEWEPIGTEQTDFTPNFSSGSTNWSEMEKAIRYATGLDHNMTVWRIENGGSPTRARGVVSGPDNPGQPYEVYIEWIDGQGWKPVEKNQLSTNPYR